MDIFEEIVLNEKRSVDSVNEDSTIKFSLESPNLSLNNNKLTEFLNINEVFQNERNNTLIYRIHGDIDYLSILNNTITSYTGITDFFKTTDKTKINKSIYTDFDFYLVRPTSGYTQLNDNKYIKNYVVIATLDNIDIQKAGFSKNIYNEQKFSFIINKDIDLDYYDGLGFPITDVYLYCEYKTQINGSGNQEILERKTYDLSGNSTIETYSNTQYQLGDVISGDVITYTEKSLLQSNYNLMEYYISTPYNNGSDILKFKYRPYIKIELRKFENEIRRINTGSTDSESVSQIPIYAKEISDDLFIWKDFIEYGFFDPITGEGLNFPFVNKKHYVYSNIILKVQPDLTHPNTQLVFNQIKLGNNVFINNSLNNNIENVNKLCS